MTTWGDRFLAGVDEDLARFRVEREQQKAALDDLDAIIRKAEKVRRALLDEPAAQAAPKRGRRDNRYRMAEQTRERFMAHLRTLPQPFTAGDLKGNGIIADTSVSSALPMLREAELIRLGGKSPDRNNAYTYYVIDEGPL